jgi:hypothetical protein
VTSVLIHFNRGLRATPVIPSAGEFRTGEVGAENATIVSGVVSKTAPAVAVIVALPVLAMRGTLAKPFELIETREILVDDQLTSEEASTLVDKSLKIPVAVYCKLSPTMTVVSFGVI